MIVLHAGVLDGKLLLWAETNIKEPDTITVKKPRQKSNPRTAPAAPPHFDYDAGAEKLLAAFESIGLDHKIHIKRSTKVSARENDQFLFLSPQTERFLKN